MPRDWTFRQVLRRGGRGRRAGTGRGRRLSLAASGSHLRHLPLRRRWPDCPARGSGVRVSWNGVGRRPSHLMPNWMKRRCQTG